MPTIRGQSIIAWETIVAYAGGEAVRVRIRQWYERSFPERREIILRSDGRMRYLAVGRRTQAAVAAAAVGVAVWTVIATGGFVVESTRLSSERAEYTRALDEKDRQIAAWQQARDQLLQTLESYRDENAFVNLSLRENKAEVERLSKLNSEMSSKVAELGVSLSDAQAERERVAEARRGLQERLASLEGRLREFAKTKVAAEKRLETVAGLLGTTEADQERLEAERNQLEQQLAALQGDVGALKSTRGALLGELQQTESRLSVVMADRDRIVAQREGLEDQLALFRGNVGALIETRQQLEARLQTAEAGLWTEFERRSRVVLERDQLQDRLAALQEDLDALVYSRNALSRNLESTTTRLSDVAEDRDRLARERDRLAGSTETLKDRLVALEAAQTDVIGRLGAQAAESIELVQQAVAITGLDLEQMLARTTPASNQGGPFVPLLPTGEPGAEMASSLADLEASVEQWRSMQDLLSRLPLAAPLEGYRLTSPFGRRSDPISKRAAMHSGADLKSDRGSPIYATAPGRVTFVGWNGGYGKFIEIDHGFGIRTRYAHLDKILVERGQEVEFRDKIGLVGSTGRSTGPHLHYEVMADGRQRNPMSFIRAGQYVFKR